MPYWNLSVCCPTNCIFCITVTEFIKTRYEFYTISTEIQKSMWNYWIPYEIFHKEWQTHTQKKTRYWFKQLSFHKPHSKSLNCTMWGKGGDQEAHSSANSSIRTTACSRTKPHILKCYCSEVMEHRHCTSWSCCIAYKEHQSTRATEQ